jgi:hypothetical protein
MRDTPRAEPAAVEAYPGEEIEPVANGAGSPVPGSVPQEPDTVQLTLADHRLGIDDEPRLALGLEDVARVQILVRKGGRAALGGLERVERQADKRTVDPLGLTTQLLRPARREVVEREEGMRLGRLAPETRQELGQDGKLVRRCVPQLRAGPAALDEQGTTFVVPGRQPNGAVAVPELQRIGLVLGLVMRRRVQLEDAVAGRDDQRP